MQIVLSVEDHAAAALETGSVGAAERVILDDVAGVRCVDELAVADIDADMADRVSAAAEEYQIARQKLVTGDAGRGVELRLRHALDRADRVLVDVGCKAGAVKTCFRRFTAASVSYTEIWLCL